MDGTIFVSIEKAAAVRSYLKIWLLKLRDKFESIGNVRGIGLVCGIELVMEKTTKESAAYLTKKIVLDCVANGLMARKLGIYGHVMRSPRRS